MAQVTSYIHIHVHLDACKIIPTALYLRCKYMKQYAIVPGIGAVGMIVGLYHCNHNVSRFYGDLAHLDTNTLALQCS